MSAGISRSRLMEERKQWRKDHPHVNNLDTILSKKKEKESNVFFFTKLQIRDSGHDLERMRIIHSI